MTATTFRRDTADGILSTLNGVKAAHPDLLVAVYRAQPPGFPDLPCAYIDSRPEDIGHSTQIRTRMMHPEVVIVDRITDNAETMLRMDILVDYLVDAFTAAPQFSTGDIWDQMTIRDEVHDFGEYKLAAVRLTFPNVSDMVGRGNP